MFYYVDYVFVDPPTNELVQKVKELYNKRVSDVRFLIPVLNGLQKHEIVEVLPKLILHNSITEYCERSIQQITGLFPM